MVMVTSIRMPIGVTPKQKRKCLRSKGENVSQEGFDALVHQGGTYFA
jgi:hypothetical protein